MERLDPRSCYSCGRPIGMLRAALFPVEATFESPFDGTLHASFCSTHCRQEGIDNAAAVRRTFPPPPPTTISGEMAIDEALDPAFDSPSPGRGNAAA